MRNRSSGDKRLQVTWLAVATCPGLLRQLIQTRFPMFPGRLAKWSPGSVYNLPKDLVIAICKIAECLAV